MIMFCCLSAGQQPRRHFICTSICFYTSCHYLSAQCRSLLLSLGPASEALEEAFSKTRLSVTHLLALQCALFIWVKAFPWHQHTRWAHIQGASFFCTIAYGKLELLPCILWLACRCFDLEFNVQTCLRNLSTLVTLIGQVTTHAICKV